MPPTSSEALTGRIQRLLLVLLLAFAAVGLTLVFWGILRAESLAARDDNPRQIEAEMRVRRGRILDRADRVLADMEGETERLRRVYPLATAGPSVGYASVRHGTIGIEQSFDAYLRGEAEDDWARFWQRAIHVAPEGRDLRLTLDATLQDHATRLMDGHNGALVVLDLGQPGEPAAIRAMVSRPGYDPNLLDEQFEDLAADASAPLLNRAAQGLYQPGLLLSPFILAGALDRGLLDDAAVPADLDAPVAVNGRVVQCATPPIGGTPSPTWLELIGLGCPAPLTQLGQGLGGEALDDLFAAFGLRDQPVVPIATAESSPPPVADPALAAIGQENLTITPLQAARAFATLAQDGSRPPLQLVAGLQNENGQWLGTTPGEPAIEATGAQNARRVLAALPSFGQGREMTATALAGPGGGTNDWYIGLTPGGRPDRVVALVLENADDPALAAEIGREVLGVAAGQP